VPFPVKKHGDIHGTPAAGVAIAESNGVGVVGAAPGCAFMPVRFPVKASDEVLIDIFEEVAKKADVISCSWGPPPVYSPLNSKLDETIRTIATNGGPRNKGCVICVAAGNYNSPLNSYNLSLKSINSDGFTWLDDEGHLKQTTGLILNDLACHPNVIAVAASTSLNKHAAYSNWGHETSVCAPSDNFNPLNLRKLPGLRI
jgi:subtilisin family serine protease